MHIRNTASHYGIITQALHWGMFLMLSGMIILGFIMEEMSLSPEKLNLIFWHKSFGITLLFLALLRLTWRLVNPSPALPSTTPTYQRLAAHITHYALYVFMLFIPLSGWLMSSAAKFPVPVFGWFTMPDLIAPDKDLMKLFHNLHGLAVYGLLAILIAHIGAALLHHFVFKDAILKRMITLKD